MRRAAALLRDALAAETWRERRRRQRLGSIVADDDARELVQRLTDEILRLPDDRRAACRFARLVADSGVPPALGPVDRALLTAAARLATRWPSLVMPLARARILHETRGLAITATDPGLARHIRRRRRAGFGINLNVLGEAILSDDEAEQRLRRVLDCIARVDVDHLSVKISAVVAQLDVLAFEHSVDRVSHALRLLYDAAARERVHVTLDMEEYADLELTVAAFQRVLDEPAYHQVAAGIAIQAYLPDSHGVVDRLGAWARRRVDAGGAPIRVRLVKGANLAMEKVDAELHSWTQAPYGTKADVDASFLRLLDSLLRDEWDGAVRVGVGSHNLFDVAWVLELPRHQRRRVEIEMLEGIVPAQARVVRDAAGTVLLYCPIVRRDEVEASLAYLARRFDENTAPANYLRAMFALTPESAEFAGQAERFRASVRERHTVSTAPRRPSPVPPVVERFRNEPDSDFTDAGARDRVLRAIQAGVRRADVDVLTTTHAIDTVVVRARLARNGWAARSRAERAAVLDRVAAVMASERVDTLALMAHEAAKTVREGDPEVSEAIDFARWSARTPAPDGAQPVGTVLVASPWNFPYAIPAGGVFGALMAGNAVLLKPAPETRATARHLVEQCHRGGVPEDVLQFVACPDDDVGRHLVTHRDVDAVVLTGAHATAQLFLDWKPTMRLFAETSGKNALVITAAADEDAAIRDLVRSAFGHAGQKCSAASLAILEAPVHDDPTFLRRLAAAVQTLRVGPATDPATTMGPLIAPPGDALRRALTTLDPGESWLVRPRRLDDSDRLWSPGVKLGVVAGSWFQRTECFGPVLGIVRADDLDHAIRIQNDSAFGLTGGIHSLDDAEVEEWLTRVQVGNAYVNRHITGAVVGRQPFGGWKRSSVGGGPKPGGPAYVAGFTRGPVPVAADGELAGLAAESNVLRHVPVSVLTVESPGDEVALAQRLAAERPARVRFQVPVSDALLRACHRLDIAIDRTGWHVQEQSVSRTLHRYGRIRQPPRPTGP